MSSSKKILHLFFFLLFIGPACDKKDLDLKPSLPTGENYFLTEQQFQQGIIGIYSKLVFFYNYRGGNGQQFLHDIRLLPDDDITTNWLSPFESFTNLQPGNKKIYDYYTYLYHLNARANNMLDVFTKKADAVYTNAALKDWNKGEILFLRGFSHFQLWNLFGVSPLINKRIDNDSLVYPPNSSGTQLLDAAISDFAAAAKLLPDAWTPANKGRVTKSAAYGMTGKAYLYRASVKKSMEDYSLALVELNKVLNHSLAPRYGDNFLKTNENNSESLFEIQLGDNMNPEGSNPWLDTDGFDGNGDISGYWGFFDNHWSLYSGSRFLPTQALKDAFADTDPRKEHCFNSEGIVKYVKGTFGGDGKVFEVSYTNNARVLRYADVLLLKAEANLQSGGSTVATIQLINQVRTRARQSSTVASSFPEDHSLSETDRRRIMKWIIEERRLELAFEEGHRWFDLRRWHLAGILKDVYGKDLESGWNFSSLHTAFSFSKKNLYLPIPFEEIQINPRLAQNDLWR